MRIYCILRKYAGTWVLHFESDYIKLLSGISGISELTDISEIQTMKQKQEEL